MSHTLSTERALGIMFLALSNIKRKSFRTFCLSSIVGLFSFVLITGFILNERLNSGLNSLSARLGADVLIVPYGYEKKTEAAILRGEPNSFYMKAGVLEKIRNTPGVAAASPQFFLASLATGCCAEKVQIIGFEPDSDFLIHPWIKNKTNTLKTNHIIVGSRITSNVGDEIQFFGQPFFIAGKMDTTGMGFDTSVFMTMSAVQNLMKTSQLSNPDNINPEDYISSVAIKVSPDYLPKDVGNSIMRQHSIDYNLDLVVTKAMLTDIASRLSMVSIIIYGLAALLWLFSVLVLFIIFSSMLNERKKELSILRILGASRSWLARLILTEAFLTSLFGAIVGLTLALIIVVPFSDLIFFKIGLPNLPVSVGRLFLFVLIAAVAAIITGPLSGLYSVFSITRDDVYSTLREGE